MLNILFSFYHVIGFDDDIQPPSGTVITARGNAINVTTLQCDLFNPANRSLRSLIMWSLVDGTGLRTNVDAQDTRFLLHGVLFEGFMSIITHSNLLTILRFAPELNNQTLTCTGSHGGGMASAAFPLIVFRKWRTPIPKK